MNLLILEEPLRAAERNKLADKKFGIPSLRKYPLTDKTRVIKAIQFFSKCDKQYKKELAKNIAREAKKYDMEIHNEEIQKYLK